MSQLTITSAQYTNPTRSSALVFTEEEGTLFLHQEDARWPQVLAAAPQDVESPAPLPMPAVTQRQARLALRAAGKLAAVNAAIAGMPGDAGEDARIEWEFASTIDRASPLVAAMGAALAMDGPALDDLFRQAAAL